MDLMIKEPNEEKHEILRNKEENTRDNPNQMHKMMADMDKKNLGNIQAL